MLEVAGQAGGSKDVVPGMGEEDSGLLSSVIDHEASLRPLILTSMWSSETYTFIATWKLTNGRCGAVDYASCLKIG